MPTNSLQQKSGRNHYENHSNLVSKQENRLKNYTTNEVIDDRKSRDYTRIEYLKYKRESSESCYDRYDDVNKKELEHRYENLSARSDFKGLEEKKKSRKSNEVQDKNVTSIGEDPIKNEGGCGFRFGYGDDDRSGNRNVPEAPVRDPSSLKSIKYGPGHEKYPSWPGSVQTETGEKPQRSRSWTDQTDYPKEKVTTYARPCNKRANPAFTRQLKTVMERCEKIPPQTFQKTMDHVEERDGRIYLPRVDREGKSLGDEDYMVPSPPERDEPPFTQADLEMYYRDDNNFKIDDGDYSTPYEDVHKARLTQADLEEYSRSYDESLKPHHQHHGSYAQSEGYHSYVSSSELTITPFLDKLRRESDGGAKNHQWEEEALAGRDSVVTTSSGSASSSETLKWHGSMSDVSVASSSCRSRQLIAHSSRVPPPQRHHSESVLYLGAQSGNQSGVPQTKAERSQHLKLFPVNTYTVQPFEQKKQVISPTSVPQFSVAERISELERQQHFHKLAYLDPEKRHRVSDPTLKAIQKKALLSFYERHQHSSGLVNLGPHMKSRENWKNDIRSKSSQEQLTNRHQNSAPKPPPRPLSTRSNRRDSSASDGDSSPFAPLNASAVRRYSSSALSGPVIIGPSISIDDWVPERPPKKPHLRTVPPPLPPRSPSPVSASREETETEPFRPYEDRLPTPDLPPPPFPAPVPDDEIPSYDEPLPPPPPEAEWLLATAVPRRSTPTSNDSRAPLDSYEIEYDQDAINAIMESNRLAKDSQKVKNSKTKPVSKEKKASIENRPPLPLPRDPPQSNELDISGSGDVGKQSVVSKGHKSNMKNSNRIKKTIFDTNTVNDSTSSGSVDQVPSSVEVFKKPHQVKKVSEYESRVPVWEKDLNLCVFENKFPDEEESDSIQNKRTNSKAAFLALRREKELGLTNYEGSYKLTMSPSGESIENRNTTEKEKLPENVMPLEPPDLIPKITDIKGKGFCARDAKEETEKYRLFDDCRELKRPPEEIRANPENEPIFRRIIEEVPIQTEKIDARPELIVVTEESVEGISFSVRGLETPAMEEVKMELVKSEPEPEPPEPPEPEVIPFDTLSMSDASSEASHRENFKEELEYERLSRDLASQLSPSDKLQGLLVPESERKRPTDYVAGLFRLDLSSRPRRRMSRKSKRMQKLEATNESSKEDKNVPVNGIPPTSNERVEPLPSGSAYFTTSESKAKMLTRYVEDMDSLGLGDSQELQKKKEELMARLDKKLEILREEQVALSEECIANEELGATVATYVNKLARPHEAAKYRLHVEEIGKITSLLLGLSGRLARAENALSGLPSHHDERKIHESKRDKLKEQLTEAKQLKENIDRRSDSVAKILEKYLTEDEYADYRHFIQMKAKLIVDSREIADKISLGEEQLAALKETLSS